MKKKNLMSIIGLMFILFVSLFALSACGDNSYRTIKVFSCDGECNVVRNNNEISVQKDMLLKNNDELNVKANSQAILKLDNDKFVCAKENTSVKFVATGSKNKTKTRLHVNDGGIIVEVKEKLKNGEKFEIASSNSVMAIRGTQISFDVEKTSDSITTTFSILTGNTEIFLYKDETMNSTTLIQEYMMSYTTSLVKSTDEIYKIYDSTRHNEINDEDLENIYNVRKARISNKKINEMVEAVNEFEKIDDEIVNGVIGFDIPNNITYKIDPSTVIDVLNENKYTDYDELEYLYSSSIDGTYSPYDINNPLDAGTYYCKIKAGNAYISDPIEFKVTEIVLNFQIASQVPYGSNPRDYITIDEAYSNMEIKYSQTQNGSFTIDANNLTRGTWYAKIVEKNYTSNPMKFTVSQASIPVSLKNTSIVYGTNPDNNVTVTGSYSNIRKLYSQSRTTGFSEYSTNNPLSVGTWYVKVTSGNEYVSEILEFSVTPAKIKINLTSDSIVYGTNPNTIVNINGTYSNVKYLYSTTEIGEFKEFDVNNPLDAGFYYVKVVSGNEYISDILDFEITPKEIVYSLTSTTVPYGTNPNTIVTVSETYPTITYKYSTTEDGPYSEYNVNNPLITGSYYIKLFINDNYYSVAKEFNVGKMSFNFTISSEIEYEDSIIDHITVDSMYTDLTYYYSTSESFDTSNILDRASVLDPGTYYIKITSGTMYESVIKSFEVVKANKDFTVPMGGRIAYGEDITDSFDDSFNRNIYISTSQTGTFSLYNSANEYIPGTYYIKLENDYYTSTSKQLTILKLEVEFNMTYSQKMVDDEIHVTISVDDNDFFNSNYAKEKAQGVYKYYITVTITGGTTGTYKLDYETREIVVVTNNNGFTATYSTNIPTTIFDYSFSDETYNYTPTNSFNVSSISMADNFISAEINTFVTSGTPSIKASYRVDDGEEYTESLYNSENRYYFTASGINTNSIVYIKYLFYVSDILVDESSYYTLDTSNFVSLEAGTDFTYTEPREASSLHTFNDDGTVNIYYDLGFVNNTDYNLVCEITYGTYSEGEAAFYYDNQKIVYTSSPILELLDLPFNKYAICGFRVLNVVDGINYVVFDDEEDYDMDLIRPLFTGGYSISAYDGENDGEYDLSASDAYILEEDGVCTVTVKLTDYNYENVYQEIVFTEYPDNEVQVNTYDVTEADLFVIVSYTRISIMTTDLLNKLLDASYSTTQKLTNTLFNQVKQAFVTKYGITVKGNNTLACNNHTSFSPQEY